MQYKTVILSDTVTLRAHTVRVLKEFKRLGGKLIVVGNTPKYVGGERSDELCELLSGVTVIGHAKDSVLRSISEVSHIDMRLPGGVKTKNLMCTVRRDGESLWLFAAHMYKPELSHLINREDVTFTVEGCYRPTLYDTLSGEIKPLPYKACKEKTEFYITLYDLDTMLVRLDVCDESSLLGEAPECEYTEIYHPHTADYTLSEPNVLLLDMARYSLDGEAYSEREEEILRIDAEIRDRLGYMQRRVKFVQPWAIEKAREEHTVTLLYTVKSDIEIDGCRLALELLEKSEVRLNGTPVTSPDGGYYIDKYVKTLALPTIHKGENIIEIKLPFGLRTDLESAYLIGDFGVECIGRDTKIIEKREKLNFGSVVNQGLAFYGANIDYSVEVEIPEDGELEITATHYRGAVIGVALDGERVGRIAFQPFTLRTPPLKAGKHRITYTLFGTRYNTLTALHNLNADKHRMYIGPIYWRSEGEAWSYEYNMRPMGILKTPTLRFYKK